MAVVVETKNWLEKKLAKIRDRRPVTVLV